MRLQQPRSRKKKISNRIVTPFLVLVCPVALGFLVQWLSLEGDGNLILLRDTQSLTTSSSRSRDRHKQICNNTSTGQYDEIWNTLCEMDFVPECKDLFARVKAGLLADPNYTNDSMIEKAMYPRQTVTDPSFFISLHDRATDFVRWSIMDTGSYYENFITRHTKFVLGQTHWGILIDVGMNIGWFSLWALALGAKVYGFEPNPINRLRFCESIDLNKFPISNIHLYNNALSNEEADMLLSHMPGNPGSAGLVSAAQGKKKLMLKGYSVIDGIRVVRLDDVAEKEGWLAEDGPVISLLKIDVEGYDPKVIFGAARLLKSRKVKNVFMEYSCRISDEQDMIKAVDMLLEAGYEIQVIGNWNGAPRHGAKESVHTYLQKNLGDRLYAYCKAESRRPKGAVDQLNLWWKLDKSNVPNT
jgi:FkbM family methyltransferase